VNSDGTTADDLASYNIYRAYSLNSIQSAALIRSVPSGNAISTWADTTVLGGRFYYFIRSCDMSGIESDNSLIIDCTDPGKLTLVSLDQGITAVVPAEVSSKFLAVNSGIDKDLTINVTRKADLELGKVIMAYDLKVQDANLNTIADYSFEKPIICSFNYQNAFAASKERLAPAISQGEMSVYWFNNVEYIRVGGYVNQSAQKVTVTLAKPGQYQLREVKRASVFGVASIFPSRIFTPGIAPYEKAYFYIDNPEGDKVIGKVFDLRGEFVADIPCPGDATATSVIFVWEGKNVHKGVYIYQFETTKRIVNGTIMVAR